MTNEATQATIKSFAELLASSTDENERNAWVSRAKMLALQDVDPKTFEPPIRTLGEYLDSEIPVPPVLVEPSLVVRGGITCTIGRAGFGKRSSDDTPVMTPTGWKRIDTLRVGDSIIDPDGGESKVTGVFPAGIQETYRAHFSDGTSTKCGPEHLWLVKRWSSGKDRRWIIRTLEEISEEGLLTIDKRHKWFIPVTQPCEYEEKSLGVHPYIIGVLLGDGCITGSRVDFVAADREIADRVRLLCPETTTLKHIREIEYRIVGPNKWTDNPVAQELRRLGLWGKYSYEKFIPDECFLWSIEQRQELLAGLLDTDGGITRTEARFYSCSESLARGVAQLTRSLGGKALIYSRKHVDSKINERVIHSDRIHFVVAISISENPFRLSRKVKRWKKSYRISKAISKIERVADQPCRCISTSSKRSLYLVDDYIVTHNTQVSLNRILKWSAGRPLFDNLKNKDGLAILGPTKPLKTLIIENEGSAGLFHKQLGIMLNAEGYLTDEDRKMARENVLVYGDGGWSGLKLDSEKDLNLVKAGCEKWKPDLIFLEPFRGLWKGDENSATDMAVVADALSEIAANYDCAVLICHHERKSGVGEDGEKMSAGRGSTVLEGAAAVLEHHQKAKGDDFRELSWSKVRYGSGHALLPVRMQWQPSHWWYAHIPLDQLEQDILNELAEADPEPLTIRDLIERTDEKEHTVRRIVKSLLGATPAKIKKQSSRSDGNGSTGLRYRLANPSTGGENLEF